MLEDKMIEKLPKEKWYTFAIKRLVELEKYRADRSFRDSYTFSRLISSLHQEVQDWLPLFNDINSIMLEDRPAVAKCLSYLLPGDYKELKEIIDGFRGKSEETKSECS